MLFIATFSLNSSLSWIPICVEIKIERHLSVWSHQICDDYCSWCVLSDLITPSLPPCLCLIWRVLLWDTTLKELILCPIRKQQNSKVLHNPSICMCRVVIKSRNCREYLQVFLTLTSDHLVKKVPSSLGGKQKVCWEILVYMPCTYKYMPFVYCTHNTSTQGFLLYSLRTNGLPTKKTRWEHAVVIIVSNCGMTFRFVVWGYTCT